MAARNMDAVALLKADHRKVAGLFKKFESAKGAADKRKLVKEICTELCVHTAIEEEIFYPACKGEVEKDILDEAYVEHDGAKALLTELIEGSPSDAFYDAKVSVLSEMIEHHVEEEEKRSEGLFAQAKAAGLPVDDLGERMKMRKEKLVADIKAKGLPALKTRSFSGPAMKHGHPVN
jgi:hypothetical protein